MASTKLTNLMRDRIVADLLVHRFGKIADKLIKDRAALASKVYRELYPRSTLAKIDALPEGWLPSDNDMRARLGSHYDQLPLDGSVYGEIAKIATKTDPVFKRFLSHHKGGCVLTLDATHALSIVYEELDIRRRELIDQIKAAQRQAEAAVDTATTIGRLIELWPEIKPFAIKHETARMPLPALPVGELNALLDLPVAA